MKQKAVSARRVNECGELCIYFINPENFDDKRYTLILL